MKNKLHAYAKYAMTIRVVQLQVYTKDSTD